MIERRFTPDEARQIGFVPEAAVDWSHEVKSAKGRRRRPPASTLQPAEPVTPSMAAVIDPEAAKAQLGPETTESGDPGEPTGGPS